MICLMKKVGIYLRIKSDNLKFDEKLAKALEDYHFSLPFYQKAEKLKVIWSLKLIFMIRVKFLIVVF